MSYILRGRLASSIIIIRLNLFNYKIYTQNELEIDYKYHICNN